MGEFAGLRVLVTGGASGIGAAAVALFLERGASVACLDLTGDGPAGCLPVVCDVGDNESVERAVTEAARALGGLDVVINNAGIGAQGDVAANDDDEWSLVFNINVRGPARITAAALPFLRKSEQAVVVNTCSVLSVLGVPNRALYAASKGALLALTLAMAADHVREGIRFNAVTPGTAATPWVERLISGADDPDDARQRLANRQPMGRLVSAAEVAHAIAYLASPLSGSTTGTVLAVDAGMASLRLPT